ncbi:polycystin family receptor for egg jelly-like [Antedon mediterranea]|uniref:polycystin family receptor for egg jelly-like n=1 Tax=Antedon mediterranea TaxID=105859 RepID=UPI003AF8FC35
MGNATSGNLPDIYLSYSADGESWNYTQTLSGGNQNGRLQKRIIFEDDILTRYIRLHIINLDNLCVRFDLLGCKDSRLCHGVLGLESGIVTDDQITASSIRRTNVAYWPHCARLNDPTCSWWPYTVVNEWIMVMFDRKMILTGLITQGSPLSTPAWVTQFHVAFSIDLLTWTYLKDKETVKLFKGNTDQHSYKKNVFDYPIIVHSARIYPVATDNFLRIRMEWLGCYAPPVCQDEIRIFTNDELKIPWRIDSINPELIVDLGQIYTITGILIKGTDVGWSFELGHSFNEHNWNYFSDRTGNIQKFKIAGPEVEMFSTTFDTRFIRFEILSTSTWLDDLEFVLYGCNESSDIYLTGSNATNINIIITFFNLINSVSVSANVSFIEEIQNFDLVESPQYAVYGKDIVIAGSVSFGSNMTSVVEINDARVLSYTEQDSANSQIISIIVLIDWNIFGKWNLTANVMVELLERWNFTANVIVYNDISYPVTVSRLFLIQYEIVDLKNWLSDKYIKTFQKMDAFFDMKVGSHLHCIVEQGDGIYFVEEINYMSRDGNNIYQTKLKYTEPGFYIFSVSCVNNVSFGYVSTNATVQNEVSKINVANFTEIVRMTSSKNSTFEVILFFTGDINYPPTDATAQFTFIDELNDDYQYFEELDYIISVPELNVFYYFEIDHWSSYSVKIKIINEASKSNTKIKFEAEDSIENLEFFCPGTAKVNEKVIFNFSVSAGSRIQYTIDFMDGNVDIIDGESNFAFMHSYSISGVYTVKLSARNLVDVVNKTVAIIIQLPIDGFDVYVPSLIKLDTDIMQADVEVMLTHSNDFNFPTDAHYKVDVNEVNFHSGVLYENTSDFLLSLSLNQSGKYRLEYHIWNLVSYEIYVSDFVVMEEINGLTVILAMNKMNLSMDLEVPSHDGKLYQPLDHSLIMTTHIATGTNVTYTWMYEPNGQTKTSQNSQSYYSFTIPNKYEITLNASNAVSFVEWTSTVVVQETVVESKLVGVGTNVKNSTVEFKLELGKVGSDACYRVDFKDETSEGNYIQYLGACHTCSDRYGTLSGSCTELDSKSLWQTVQNGGSVTQQLENKFMTPNVYQIEFVAFNYASYIMQNFTQVITRLPCFFPNVTVADLNACTDNFLCNLLTQNRQYLASVDIFVFAEVVLDCKSTKFADFTWEVYKKNDRKEEKYTLPENIKTTNIGLSELVIPAKTLSYGTYRFSLTVTMLGNEIGLVTTDSTTIEIIPTSLHIGINYGTFRSIGWNKLIMLDASELTYDPDIDEMDKSGMNFTWLCRRKTYKMENTVIENIEMFQQWDEEFKVFIAESSSNNAFNSYKEVDDTGGCFGRFGDANGHVPGGVLNVSGPVVTIDSYGMYWDMEYEVWLTVWKKDRSATFKQILDVHEGTPPDVELSCKLNCKIKKNPTNRLSIEAKEKDAKRGIILYYRWQLFMFQTSYLEIEQDILMSYATTGIDVANLSLEPGIFLENTKYRIHLTVSRNADLKNAGLSKLDFDTNDTPVKGECQVNPLTGVESVTDFIISCSNYKDNDIPLVYQYSIRQDNTTNWAIIYSGYETVSNAAQFPAGLESNNYNVTIRVRVTDSFGSYIEDESISVQVKPSLCSYEMISDKYDEVVDSVASLAATGGFGSVCNAAISISGFLNRCTKMAEEEYVVNNTIMEMQASIREQLLNSMSSLTPAYTLSSMNQMASALDQLTQYIDQITLEAMQFLEYLVSTFVETLRFVVGVSAEELEESAKLAFYSLGRLQNSKNSNDTGSKVIQYMTDSVTKLMVTGQNDVKISSQTVAVTVSKVFTLAILNGTEPFSDQNNKPIMKIPDVQDLFGISNDSSTELQVQVIARTNNPYPLDNSSVELGSMISLDMKNDTGQTVIPAHPDVPIEFMIQLHLDNSSQNASSLMEDVYSYEESENGLLSCKNLDDIQKYSAVVVEVTAHSNDDMLPNITYQYDIEVFLKVNGTASEDDYDLSCTLSQLLTTHNKTANEFYPNIPWNKTLLSTVEVGRDTYYGISYYSLFIDIYFYRYIYSTGSVSVCVRNNAQMMSYSASEEPSVLRFLMGLYTSACYYRTGDTWNQEGCEVGNKTTVDQTQCFCLLIPPETSYEETTPMRRRRSTEGIEDLQSDVATFSGGLAVSFNKIELTVGLNQLAENPTVFAFMLSCICFYFVVIFWARKEDKRDMIKAGVCPMIDNNPCDYYNYEVTFFTGVRMGSGTTANVFFILNGEQGQTEIRAVKDKKRLILQRSSIDSFVMAVPRSLGTLVHLRIWHDNSGNAKWFLSRVLIKDLQTNRSYYFMIDRWFSLEHDDMQIERVIPTAGISEITSFGHLFYSKTRRNLSDAHLWLSVFFRPARSTFTRCQRATCCLSLLFCTMMANILMYQTDEDPDAAQSGTFAIGSFKISVMEITIGVISSLMVFPVNIAIVQLFRLSRPISFNRKCHRHKKMKSMYVENNKTKVEQEISPEKAPDNGMSGQDPKLTSVVITINEGKKTNKSKKRKPLPWWCLYVGWVLSFITIGIAMWLTIGVAANFGAEKAEQWLMSICVSLTQDILVSQPIKVIFLATFYSLVIKSPDKDEDGPSPELKTDEEWLHEQKQDGKGDKKVINDSDEALNNALPPDSDEIEELKKERQKDIQMSKILKEIVTYLLFLIIMIIITFGNIGSGVNGLQRSMTASYINADYNGKKPFYKIYSREYFWDYMDEVFVPTLYSRVGFNGTRNEINEIEQLAADRTSSLLSTARLRQVRVQEDYCDVPNEFETLGITCKPAYSFGAEEDRHFTENWILLNQTGPTVKNDYENLWKYKTWYELDNLPLWGVYGIYGGGGYIADLGDTDEAAWKTTKYLRESKWVDQHTRAVFIEFSVYNPATNLFGVSNMVVEFPPTGGAVTFYSFQGVFLDRYIGGLGLFINLCEVVFSFFILLFLVREYSNIKQERKAYFKKFSNLIEFAVLLLSILALIAYINRYIFGKRLKTLREDDIKQYLNFQHFAIWEQMYYYILGFILFISTAKFLKLLRFNRRMLLLSNTISCCWLELLLFLMVFLIIFAAYASCGYLLFGSTLKDYSSYLTTLESLFATLLGKFDFLSMQEENRVLGALFFFSFMMTIVFILMNMFLTIINEAFSQTRADNERLNNELEMLDFMINRFKVWTGFKEKRARVRRRYTYIEGVEPIQSDCDTMQQKLNEMVEKLNEFIRLEKYYELGIMKSGSRKIYTC